MRIRTLLVISAVFGSACSSSTSDRPSSYEEQQAEIARDQERAEADADRDVARPAVHDEVDDGTEADERRATAPAVDPDAEDHEPDNTGKNERDDEPGNLTALDQSNDSSDVEITRAIRKKVVADDALSFDAKNVKIITVGGKVTLRGPVESAQESSAIEKSARAVPGVVAVDNQIEVER